MLRVTIELLPHGDATRKEILGTALIANDLTGTLEEGNYNCALFLGKTRPRWGNARKAWKAGRVERFRREQNAWYLLRDALTGALPS